jgi:hypothetical protein
MIKILSKKIKDKHFLKLILQGFESGIYCKDIYENTTLGIPQGVIASPILFNIYMHEFESYILYDLKEDLNKINISEKRSGRRQSKNYTKIKKKRENVANKMQTILRQIPQINKYHNMTTQQREKYKALQKEYKQWTQKMRKTPTKAMKDSPLFISYTRYADDWIILTNANKELAEIMKNKIQNWIEENLKLQLSLDKTKITDVQKEPALFLGFRISNNQKATYITRRAIQVKSTGEYKRIKQRAARGLFIDIDHDRVKQRLVLKQILTNEKTSKPRHKIIYIVLKENEIISRYRMHMEGLFQYYWTNITFKSALSRYHYYLYYSCVKTLAARQKSSLRKIMSKYTRNLIYKWEEKYINKKEEMVTVQRKTFMPTYIQLMQQTKRRMEKSAEKHKINTDFLTIRVNLRTAYKFTKYCCICGCTPPSEIS